MLTFDEVKEIPGREERMNHKLLSSVSTVETQQRNQVLVSNKPKRLDDVIKLLSITSRCTNRSEKPKNSDFSITA